MKDMPKGLLPPNPLEGKHWTERLVLGSLWQAGKQERFFLDLGPTLAWRFSERVSMGLGGQYRLHLSVREKPFVAARSGWVATASFRTSRSKAAFLPGCSTKA